MRVLVLTNQNVSGTKPKLFVTSAIHAREYTTAELTTRFAESLVNEYGVAADATWLLDHHEVHLMLQANPDGRKHAEAGQLWRKNVNENYCTGDPSGEARTSTETSISHGTAAAVRVIPSAAIPITVLLRLRNPKYCPSRITFSRSFPISADRISPTPRLMTLPASTWISIAPAN